MRFVKKRVISLVLCIFLMMPVLCPVAFADDDSIIIASEVAQSVVELQYDDMYAETYEESTQEETPVLSYDRQKYPYLSEYCPDLKEIETPILYEFNSLTAIAKKELSASDNTEFPLHSDAVKYNFWFHGRRVSNEYICGEYNEEYGWTALFVSWCADQSGLTMFNVFPKTNSGDELYEWLTKNRRNLVVYKDKLTSDKSPFVPKPDDIIFFSGNDGYNPGIVVDVNSDSISYIMGDVDCTVKEITRPISALPDDVQIVRWKRNTDYLLPYAAYMEREMGLTLTGAIGVLANMQCESGFNPHALGDGGTSYGLCQWHGSRWRALMETCEAAGIDWTTTEGQLYFLAQELQENRNSYLVWKLNACARTAAGSGEAAKHFCLDFERPAGGEESAKARSSIAEEILFPVIARRW